MECSKGLSLTTNRTIHTNVKCIFIRENCEIRGFKMSVLDG